MEMNEVKYFINAKIEDCEIRKVEDKLYKFIRNGKILETHSILLTVDVGTDCHRIYLRDKDMHNLSKYKRGMVGTFFIRIDVLDVPGTKSKILVTDFKEQKNEQR